MKPCLKLKQILKFKTVLFWKKMAAFWGGGDVKTKNTNTRLLTYT